MADGGDAGDATESVSSETLKRLERIRLLLLDVDGVLTDGGIVYSDDESEIKDTLAPGGFSLDYHGKLAVNGEWRSPGLLFTFAKDEYDCIRRYVSWLRKHGYLVRGKKSAYGWWKEPIFCGWREQIARSLLQKRRANVTDPAVRAEVLRE